MSGHTSNICAWNSQDVSACCSQYGLQRLQDGLPIWGLFLADICTCTNRVHSMHSCHVLLMPSQPAGRSRHDPDIGGPSGCKGARLSHPNGLDDIVEGLEVGRSHDHMHLRHKEACVVRRP